MLYVNNYKDFVFAVFTVVYLHVGVRYCLYFCALVKSTQHTDCMTKQHTISKEE